MAQTPEGAKKASQTMRATYGEDYYKRIGATGGAGSSTGGFASDLIGPDGLTGRQRARRVGGIGGRKSKRGPKWQVLS